MGLAIYAMTLAEKSGVFVPLLVGLKALRRATRSKGFNRWIYLYATAVAFGVLLAVALTMPKRDIAYVLSVAGAWATLPLWLWICDHLRATPSRFRRYVPHLSV